MKRNFGKAALALAMALVAIAGMTIAVGAQMNGKFRGNNQMQGTGVAATAVTAMTDSEKASLVYMREEEKLAHDVYLALSQKWGSSVFAQIAGSEQRHTESIAVLLEKYGIADPAEGVKAGVFANKQLQELYDSLVAEGSKSLIAALAVGATIEDLDIADLDEALETAKNADLIRVYENLKAGSVNHMKAFYSQLKTAGGDYTPKYISSELFSQIISEPVGQARMNNGSGMGKGKGGNRAGANGADCVCDEPTARGAERLRAACSAMVSSARRIRRK